jgi:hypothetical protein
VADTAINVELEKLTSGETEDDDGGGAGVPAKVG